MVAFCSVTDMCTACDDDDNVIKCLWTDLLDDMFTKTWTQPCEAAALAEDLHEMEPNSPDCKRWRAPPTRQGGPFSVPRGTRAGNGPALLGHAAQRDT